MGRCERELKSQGGNPGQTRNAGPAPARTPPPAPAAEGRTAGFTLLEMMVAIVVMGVLTAAVIVNWSSFMRHQELRGDAINLHKEIVALKARAIGEGDSMCIDYSANNGYSIQKWDPSTTTKWVTVKTVVLSNGVHVANPDINLKDGGELTQVFCTNCTKKDAWAANNLKIIADYKDNINTFDSGNVALYNDKVKGVYLIQKNGTLIRPEIYYCAKARNNGSWTGGVLTWKRL